MDQMRHTIERIGTPEQRLPTPLMRQLYGMRERLESMRQEALALRPVADQYARQLHLSHSR